MDLKRIIAPGHDITGVHFEPLPDLDFLEVWIGPVTVGRFRESRRSVARLSAASLFDHTLHFVFKRTGGVVRVPAVKFDVAVGGFPAREIIDEIEDECIYDPANPPKHYGDTFEPADGLTFNEALGRGAPFVARVRTRVRFTSDMAGTMCARDDWRTHRGDEYDRLSRERMHWLDEFHTWRVDLRVADGEHGEHGEHVSVRFVLDPPVRPAPRPLSPAIATAMLAEDTFEGSWRVYKELTKQLREFTRSRSNSRPRP